MIRLIALVVVLLASTPALAQSIEVAFPIPTSMITYRTMNQFGVPVGSKFGAGATLCVFDPVGVCAQISDHGVGEEGYGSFSNSSWGESIPAGKYRMEVHAGHHDDFNIEFEFDGSSLNLGELMVEMSAYNLRFTQDEGNMYDRVVPKEGGFFQTPLRVLSAAGFYGSEQDVKIVTRLFVRGTRQMYVEHEVGETTVHLPSHENDFDVKVYVPGNILNGTHFCISAYVLPEDEGKEGAYPATWICGWKGIEQMVFIQATQDK